MDNLAHGWKIHQKGLHSKAEQAYQRELNDPTAPPQRKALAWCYLGILYYDLGKYSQSLTAYNTAIQLHPSFPVALSNRANTLSALNRIDEAVASCEAALQLKPCYASAWTNLGTIRTTCGQLDAAIECFEKSLAHAPTDNEPAHRNLGAALTYQGHFQDALRHTAQAIQINPHSAEAHRNHATLMLLHEDFEHGWEEYEWRIQCKDFNLPEYPYPRYAGGSLCGKSLLLHAEQGLGDSIHFIRYAQLAKHAGAHVLFHCPPALCKLFGHLSFIDQIIPMSSKTPECDFYLPLMSAPHIFQTRLETIPRDTPYITPDPKLIEHWKNWLSQQPGRLKVGLVWQGNPDHPADWQRSLPFRVLDGLAHPDVTFIPLQLGHGREQLSDETALNIADPGEQLDHDSGPFMDTAAIISQLDLVIGSDTAVIHLAGALHVPTWVALSVAPDWRWMLNRDDSPWYPSVKLFRQSQCGDWSDVIESMCDLLKTIQTCKSERFIPTKK